MTRLTGRGQRAALAVVVCSLLLGCTGEREGPGRPSAPARDGSPAPVSERLEALSPLPEVRRPAAVAQRLRFLDSVTREEGATPADERRAAELEQLASRTLAQAPARPVDAVLLRLPAPLRLRISADVTAARRLGELATPQPRLPRWRIVAAPRPERLLAAYRAAQRATGVGWEHLAAIHLVETRMGRIRGVSTAGARGPMQFLPATWEIYGGDGDIDDPEDAILAAGRLLSANGARRDMAGALYRYNQSDAYVAAVQGYAGVMERDPASYRRYWHWRVIYRHVDGAVVLPQGYPRVDATPVGES